MRNISRLLLAPLVVVAQVAFQVPFTATASAASSAAVDGTTSNVVISLTTATPDPLAVSPTLPKPNFDAEVLAPLRQAQQAQAEAEAKAKAAAKAARITAEAAAAARRAAAARLAAAKAAPLIGPATGDVWYRLRMCEAGNDYTRNSGNGYYGAYQYNLGTWGNYGGYARPDLAPPSVQDAKARETQSARGWSPWPACARKLGLL